MDLLAAAAGRALRVQLDTSRKDDHQGPSGTDDHQSPYGTDDTAEGDSSGSWKRPRKGATKKEKKAIRFDKLVIEIETALSAANAPGSIGARGVAVETARQILDDRVELAPAWNDTQHIFHMPV
eukprot:12439859-Heterocapsa_arctica.AAC.1